MYRNIVFQVAVRKGSVRSNYPDPGSVDPAGNIRFTTYSRVNRSVTVQFIGKLSGNSGEGTYQPAAGACRGTMALKRLDQN